MAVICGEFRITKAEMVSGQRFGWLVRPRQIAFYLACRLSGHSLPVIGRTFGGKDHTTVLHARRKIAKMISLDLDFAEKVKVLEEKCLDAAAFERACE